MAVGNRHLGYKEALNSIERQSPGSKSAFYLNFLERMAPLLAEHRLRGGERLVACTSCGSPTTTPESGAAPVCAFCRLQQRVEGQPPVPVELVLDRRARKAYVAARAAEQSGGDV
jgi:hypothetical protein